VSDTPGKQAHMTDILSRWIPTRLITLYLAVLWTWIAFDWARWFAVGNGREGVEIAAIIAAVTAPITAYSGYIFKVFIDSRTK
jgi:hypothetical protein